MYAWVLIIWLGGGYAGYSTINDIASKGDCEWLASKIVATDSPRIHSDEHLCLAYKKSR